MEVAHEADRGTDIVGLAVFGLQQGRLAAIDPFIEGRQRIVHDGDGLGDGGEAMGAEELQAVELSAQAGNGIFAGGAGRRIEFQRQCLCGAGPRQTIDAVVAAAVNLREHYFLAVEEPFRDGGRCCVQ